MIRKILFYILGMFTIGASNALLLYFDSQINGDNKKQIQISLPEMSVRLQKEDSLDADAWDEQLRTSDMEGEKGSTSRKFNKTEASKSGKITANLERVGCICDDEVMELRKAQGACSGHGGVKYWLYKNSDGSVIRASYKKSDENIYKIKSNNSAPKITEKKSSSPYFEEETEFESSQRKGYGFLGFYDIIIMTIVCLTVAYITKILFTNK